MLSSFCRSVRALEVDAEDGPGTEAVVDRDCGGREDELDVAASLGGLEVEEEVDVEGPSTTGVVEAGSVFFLVDLGVRSR
jgi:hypothetical protein